MADQSPIFTIARNPLLCACGCGRPTPVASRTNLRMKQVAGEHQMFVTRHRKRRVPKFRFTIDETTGCWLWAGSTNNDGYGRIQRAGVHMPAHRALLQFLTGTVPADKHVDHGCRVKRCCNPLHMEITTPGENTRRTKLDHCDHLAVFRPLDESSITLDYQEIEA